MPIIRVGLTILTSTTRVIQIGQIKISPIVRKTLRKETHSQAPQVREIKIPLRPTSVTCFFCKQSGHVNSKCNHWLAKQKATNPPSVPTGCAVSMRSGVRSQAVEQRNIESDKIRQDFEPFVLEGSV